MNNILPLYQRVVLFKTVCTTQKGTIMLSSIHVHDVWDRRTADVLSRLSLGATITVTKENLSDDLKEKEPDLLVISTPIFFAPTQVLFTSVQQSFPKLSVVWVTRPIWYTSALDVQKPSSETVLIREKINILQFLRAFDACY